MQSVGDCWQSVQNCDSPTNKRDSLRLQKDSLKQQQSEAEQSILEQHRRFLDLELRKLRRCKLLQMHLLDQTLLCEVCFVFCFCVAYDQTDCRVPTGQGKLENVREFVLSRKVREKYYFWKVRSKSGKMILDVVVVVTHSSSSSHFH